MSELRTIEVCQAELCQNKGSKQVMQRLKELSEGDYLERYPKLRVVPFDCNGDCEMGPIVNVNDSMHLREVDIAMVDNLMENPDSVLGEVMHVLEKDRGTFERIIGGEIV